MTKVRITVKDLETDEVVRDLGVMSESKGERVTRGLLINMNTDKYYVDEEEVDG